MAFTELDSPSMIRQSSTIHDPTDYHSIILSFEKAFRNDLPPNIDDYRTGPYSSSLSLLLELLLSDMELRYRAGISIPFSNYRSRYPEIETRPEMLVQLIQHDVQLKRQLGLTINPLDYPSQFPLPRQTQQEIATNHTLSGYEMVREIGRGGMSTVFLARQTSLNRMVALKVLRLDGTIPETRETVRFLAEAEIIGTIRHRNIVQIYDYGAPPGHSPYLALEYLAGGTLAQRLANGPLTPEETACLIRSLASGIHHAHSLGMVHRDIKPGNILFDEDGIPKIIDFGLAKRQSADITRTQILMGTPAYMAPEQADKKAKFVGPTADVWALGAILYECLTGKRPFTATDGVAVLHAIRYDNPEKPRSINSRIPLDLEQICLKCLEKTPEDRYASADALEQDLSAWLNHHPLSIQKSGLIDQVWKWVRRNQLLAGAMLTICLTLLFAAITSTIFGLWALNERTIAAKRASDAEMEKIRADVKTQLAINERSRSEFQRSRAEKLVYANHLHAAERGWEGHRPEIAFNNLDDCRWDLRGPEYNFLYSRFTHGQIAFYGHRSIVEAVAISPDGQTVVSGDYHGNVRVWDLLNATELPECPKQVSGAITSIQFSPQGSEVAIWSRCSARLFSRSSANRWLRQPASFTNGFSGNGMHVTGPVWRFGSLMVSDRETPSALFLRPLDGQKDRLALVHSLYRQLGPINHVAISPDGKQFAVARGHTVTIHNSENGKRIGNLLMNEHANISVSAMAYSPDGSALSVAFNNGNLRLYHLTDSGVVESSSDLPNSNTSKATVHAIAFTPDSSLMLTGGATMELTAWDWRKGHIVWIRHGHRDVIRAVAVSNNGRFAVTGGEDNTVRVWDLLMTTEDRFLPEITSTISAIASSHDGTSLACIDRTNHQVMVTIPGTRQIHRRYNDVSKDVNLLAMTSDGQRMAMPCNDGTVRVINQRTGRFLLTTSGWMGKITALALSNDGGLLAVATAHSDNSDNSVKPASIRIIDVRSGHTLWVNESRHQATVAIAHFIHGNQTIATTDRDGKMYFWNIHTGQQIQKLPFPENHNIKNTPGKITCMASNARGSLLATGHDDGSILTWNMSDGSLAGQWRNPACRLLQLAFSSNSQRLVFGFRLHTGRTHVGFLDWHYNLNMVSVELDVPDLGNLVSLQIAPGDESPLVFTGHERGVRRMGAQHLQDRYWLRGAPTKINKLIPLENDTVLEAQLAEHAPVRWSLITGQLLEDNDQELIHVVEPPTRILSFHRMSSTAVVIDRQAKDSNQAGEREFCKAITSPIPVWPSAQFQKSSTTLPPMVLAIRMSKARELSVWNNSRALDEWGILVNSGNSFMANDLRMNWCVDLIGRSILTAATPAGQTMVPGFQGDISRQGMVFKP